MQPSQGHAVSRDTAAPAGTAISRTLQLLDLFCAQTGTLSRGHLVAFDQALLGTLPFCAIAERTDFAERVSDLAVVPTGTLAALARDVIAVARPVLARSLCFDDQDLIEIALEGTPDHRLAIGLRRRIAPPVTDVLIDWRERPLLVTLAGNPGARFSPSGASILVDAAAGDEALQDLLGRRVDLGVVPLRRLVAMVDAEARSRLQASLPAEPSPAAASPARARLRLTSGIERARRRYDAALDALRALSSARRVVEADLPAATEQGDVESTICTLASLADLPVVVVEAVFDARDTALLLVVLKAARVSWRTCRAVLGLRLGRSDLRSVFRGEEASFDAVSSATAARILAFLRERERDRLSVAPS